MSKANEFTFQEDMIRQLVANGWKRRTALSSATVAGKIDVCNGQAPKLVSEGAA